MGRSYWFECSRCAYRAKVSGGADRGLHFFVQTIACRDCKQLYDAVTRLRVPEESGLKNSWSSWRWLANSSRRRDASLPSFDSVLNRLLYKGVRTFRWASYKLQCPVSKLHDVQSWNTPDKCPRCGFYLEQNPVPYRIWE